MTTLLVPAEDAVRELLGIPPEVILAAHIGVGRRTDPWPRKLARRPVRSSPSPTAGARRSRGLAAPGAREPRRPGAGAQER